MSTLSKTLFGHLSDGRAADLYTLTNTGGLVAKITNWGGIVTELHTPDRAGKLGDVVLGFDSLAPYEAKHPFFGALVGRVGNRIANARFALDGVVYQLAANDGPHALHGGLRGFDKVLWTAEGAVTERGPAVRLAYVSPDGEEGYPGTLSVKVTYTLTDAGGLEIDYRATTDRRTPVNLTNHSYFNLAGRGLILDHELTIMARSYTPVDATLIPTGELAPVAGTPLDFTRPTPIGARLAAVGGEPVGYDHNFVLPSAGAEPALIARVCEPATGRVMEVETTEPGVQFYTGNFLDGRVVGKGGVAYAQHAGFCLETQHYPDSIHHASFPSTILRPGETFKSETMYTYPPPFRVRGGE
jgi:aldose 1-epimerase